MKQTFTISLFLLFACASLLAEPTPRVAERPFPPEGFSGVWTTTHTNGQKKCEARYKTGVPQGTKTSWYMNGQKHKVESFKHGKQHGKHIVWYRNGQKDFEIEWSNGKKHGRQTSWYRNGWKHHELMFDKGKRVKQVPVPGHGSPKEWGVEQAKHDLDKGIRRIYYFGPPWGDGWPPKDKESGLPVEIVSGCVVTPGFPEKIQGYNETIRASVKEAPQQPLPHIQK